MRSAECGVQLLGAEIFRQCKSTALQKSHPPVANRQSPFAVYYSLFAIRYSLSFWLGRNLALPAIITAHSTSQLVRCQRNRARGLQRL